MSSLNLEDNGLGKIGYFPHKITITHNANADNDKNAEELFYFLRLRVSEELYGKLSLLIIQEVIEHLKMLNDGKVHTEPYKLLVKDYRDSLLKTLTNNELEEEMRRRIVEKI